MSRPPPQGALPLRHGRLVGLLVRGALLAGRAVHPVGPRQGRRLGTVQTPRFGGGLDAHAPPLLLGRLGLLAFGAFVIAAPDAALILQPLVDDVVLGDAQNQVEPEDVDALQARQQGKGDVLADPALVLLGLPVELEGTDGAELGEGGEEDAQVLVVAAVGPDGAEEDEVGADEGVGEVVEAFGGLVIP